MPARLFARMNNPDGQWFGLPRWIRFQTKPVNQTGITKVGYEDRARSRPTPSEYPMPMRLLNLNRTLSHAILVAIKSSLWSHEAVQEPTVALHFDRPIAKELPIEFQVEEDL